MNRYEEMIARKRQEHGERFDPSDLDPRFAEFYGKGIRIKVETCGMTLTGTVGVTTGWKPVFLLMRTRRSIGSSWTLGKADRLLAVQRGRNYWPAKAA